MRYSRWLRPAAGVAALCAVALSGVTGALAAPGAGGGGNRGASGETATPIKHVVVIFQENVSFDHYFATYPHAVNPPGEPAFTAPPGTPSVNGLTQALRTHNPNLAQPFRLDRSQAVTCSNDHGYTAEQKAYDGGLLDRFVQSTGASYGNCNPTQVMGYYDGNTVTALWNYASHFAMSDNSYGTTFGPSTPGALNLVAGTTAGAQPANITGKVANGVVYNDLNPTYDDCSNPNKPTAALTGQNVGDLLNAKGVTWGWFQGGFTPTAPYSKTANSPAVCGSSHTNVAGAKVTDYIPHHDPFQYYLSTANPHHLPPTSTAMIGRTDQANHQYGLRDFWKAVDAGNMPAVSFLKAPGYQDGHAGYSDPLDEQTFLVDTINRLERTPYWHSTAVFINYDDSDGWYDHQMGPILMQSGNPQLDALLGPTGLCGSAANAATQDRCGLGPRLPLLVISPYARPDYVANTVSDQSSILRFIEDNWSLGRIGGGSADAISGSLNNMFDFTRGPRVAPLFLKASTGEPMGRSR